MADKKKDPKGGKTFRVSFNFSWLYLLLIIGIGWGGLLHRARRAAALRPFFSAGVGL